MKLKKILKGVSRSFYLSLMLLPKRVRWPISLAFLACKTADTIADTDLIAASERLKWLNAYREMFAAPANSSVQTISEAFIDPSGGSEAEMELTRNLPELMKALENLPPADWLMIRELVLELTQGMQIDLTTPLLATEAELDQYIYYVAGCVGRFWTKMLRQHFAFAKKWGDDVLNCGEKLGKGLQLVNILRDFPRDLRRGRCYIPKELLEHYHLTPQDLLNPKNLLKALPVLKKISEKARTFLGEAELYCALHPWHARRLTAAVKLPARCGLKTLDLLASSSDWFDPATVIKISRRQVYQILLGSLLR